jgi:ribose transport system permease protein
MTDLHTKEPPDPRPRRPERQVDASSTFDDSPLGRVGWLLSASSLPIFLILVGLVVAFSAASFDDFLSVTNLRNIAVDASILLVLSVGQTFVIITAGVDLSVGSVLVFSGVVASKVMTALGGEGWAVTLAGLGTAVASGLAWGLLNGLLITKARVPSLIVTLGTLGMALGLALLLTSGVDLTGAPSQLTDIGIGNLPGGIPYVVAISLGVALVAGVILSATRFGRYTYAIGSNSESARRAGINLARHLIKVYALIGALSGFAGFLSLARFSSTTINGHNTDNLQSIAAVVIGGTSLFGGVGTIAGTVVGVFIPAVLQNGFVIVGVQPFWQQVAVGAILILAVYLDQLRRSRYRR